MRISYQARWQRAINDIQLAGGRASEAQQRLSSGRRMNRGSDDPTGSATLLRLRAEERAIEAYGRAAADARSFLEVQDSVVQSSIAVVRDARTHVVSAANATHSDEGREAIAIEIESLRDQMISLANTRFAGLGLFAGFSSAAVAQDGSGTVTLESDDGQILRRLGPSTNVDLSLDAKGLFGFDTGDDLFRVLSDAAASIRAGDTATLSTTTLQRIDSASQKLARGIAQTGARSNQVARLTSDSDVRGEQVQTQAGSIEFVDLAEATIEVAQAGAAYEAALAATAKLGSVSLLNFLS